MDKIKIIFLLPDLGAGGAERVVSILSKEMVKNDCDVDIVSLFGKRVSYELATGVKLLNFSEYNTDKFSRVRHLRCYLKQQKMTYKKVFAIAFQNSCLRTLILSAIGVKVKIIATERTNPYKNGTSFSKRLRASLPYILSDKSVFQTPMAAAYYLGIMPKHKKVICNPITRTNYRWGKDIDSSKIISVCRITEAKNLPITLEVIKLLNRKHPNVHLDIYGEGELMEEIHNRIHDMGLGDHIAFRGLTNEVQKTLSNYSVFLSTSDYEGISNSMLEAMSVGMPIVCTDCPIGGARMMLSDECGELCEVGNAESIASAIERLLDNPDYSRMIAKNAYNKSMCYSEEKIAQEWYDFLVK